MKRREPQHGDFVQSWFNTGGKTGTTMIYGKVVAAGPKTFRVRWESGTNRVRRDDPGDVRYVPRDEVDAVGLRRLET